MLRAFSSCASLGLRSPFWQSLTMPRIITPSFAISRLRLPSPVISPMHGWQYVAHMFTITSFCSAIRLPSTALPSISVVARSLSCAFISARAPCCVLCSRVMLRFSLLVRSQ